MKGLRGRAALAVVARERLQLGAAVAGVGRQNAQHVVAIEDLEDRIENAERLAANSRSCAEDRRDEALGHDRAGDLGAAEDDLERAIWHDGRAEERLRTAQAIRNEWRVRRWEVRKSAA